MSECTLVERPFLNQLASLGWKVVDQGPGIPSDPTKSFRTSFREIILPDIFRQSLHAINRTEQGQPWLSDKQIGELIDQIGNQPARSLDEANEAVLKLLDGLRAVHACWDEQAISTIAEAIEEHLGITRRYSSPQHQTYRTYALQSDELAWTSALPRAGSSVP